MVIDKAIITLRIEDEQLDLEVPTFIPISEVRKKIRDIIANVDYKDLSIYDNGEFICHNNILNEEMSFAQLGIWEGSIVEIK